LISGQSAIRRIALVSAKHVGNRSPRDAIAKLSRWADCNAGHVSQGRMNQGVRLDP